MKSKEELQQARNKLKDEAAVLRAKAEIAKMKARFKKEHKL